MTIYKQYVLWRGEMTLGTEINNWVAFMKEMKGEDVI